MILIALTGSVGTGKTETCKYFIKKKIPVFDCDKNISRILKEKKTQEKIRKFFPSVFSNTTLNKEKLADIVFKDENKLLKLEQILYSELQIKQSKWIRKKIMRRERIVVFDVPLLFEKDDLQRYDLIISVICSTELQKLRVLKRKGWDQNRFNNVIKLQINHNIKKKLSNITIKTDRNKRNTYNMVNKTLNMCNYVKPRAINKILRRFK